MTKNPSSQSAISHPRTLLAFALCSVAALLGTLSFHSFAATPASGTLSPATPTLTYTDTLVTNTTGSVLGEPVCTGPNTCSDFTLTVNAQSVAATKQILIEGQWTPPQNDFDMFITNAAGTVIASNLQTANPSAIILPVPADGTVYHIIIEASVGAGNLDGLVQLIDIPAPVNQGAGAPPRYMNYAGPSGLANDSGEPSIGVDWNPNVATLKYDLVNTGGVAFFTANLNQYRADFDDCSSPAINPWLDVTDPNEQLNTLDPIGFTDHYTTAALGTSYPPPHTPGRTFQAQLAAGDSITSFTDDDGATHTPSQGGGAPAGPDHQTLGGGPFHAPVPTPLAPAYPNAIYYCSQSLAEAECSRSEDGGITFGAGVPIFNPTQCLGGIHGHVKVSPQGTVYLPNSSCGTTNPVGTNGVAVSKDNGITWNSFTVPASTGGQDPSLGIGQNGVGKPAGQVPNTIYLGYISADGHAHTAHSGDEGTTWQNDIDVGSILGVKNAVFPVVVTGDDNRAAYGFLGTTTAGPIGDPSFQGIWHLYIAHTYDGGQTWILVDATPIDPVQKGSVCLLGLGCSGGRNLLDFNDFTVDAQGRAMVGFADGCVNCTNAPGGQSGSAKGTIARQSGGRRLFAAFDPVEPRLPAPPQLLSTVRTDPTHVTVSWLEPDNGGSPITGYNVYRSTTTGTETFLASVSGVTTNKYFDVAAPDTSNWFYRVTAVNAVSEGTFCREKSVNGTPPPPVSVCILPGLTILTDPTGDNTGMQPAQDIQSLKISEAYFGSATDKIAFTLKMASLATLTPDTYWATQFKRGGVDYTVRMSTFPPATVTAPVFEYYTGTVNALLPTTTAADPASTFLPDGTIRIIVPRSGVGNPAIGSNLTLFLTRIQVNLGGATLTPDNMPDLTTAPDGSYTIVGNQFCRPNTPPIPVMTATPQSGTAPLAVMFDATASNDLDTTAPADTIASYTLNFGDGSPVVTQSTPTFSHTYPSAGFFPARLTVKDSRNLASLNYTERVIEVEQGGGPIQLAGVVSRKTHGAPGTFDISLPASGAGIECRSGGANKDYTLVFVFPNTLASVAGASVTTGVGSVSSSAISGTDAHQYIVNLTGVNNAQNITVTLTNAFDTLGNSGNVSATMGVLLGDTSANRAVNSSDIGQAKGNSGQATTAANFRTDVTINGSINSSDIGTVKAQSGTSLPALP